MKLKDFYFRIDIKRTREIEPFEVVQGDYETNVFNITLLDGDAPYDLYNLDVKIIFKKADGTTVEQSEIEKENEAQGKIKCVLKTNTISCPGKVIAEIKIFDSEKTLTSTKFCFGVRKSLLDDETIKSTNEFTTLVALIKETNDLIDSVRQIEEQVPESVVARLDVLEDLTQDMKNRMFGKNNIRNIHSGSTDTVPSSALVQNMQEQITTLNDNLGVIGNASNTVSVPPNTRTTITSLSLSPGTYMVSGEVDFNVVGNYACCAYVIVDTIISKMVTMVNVASTPAYPRFDLSDILTLPVTTTVHLMADHNNSANITCHGKLKIMRVK